VEVVTVVEDFLVEVVERVVIGLLFQVEQKLHYQDMEKPLIQLQ